MKLLEFQTFALPWSRCQTLERGKIRLLACAYEPRSVNPLVASRAAARPVA
jgi:hypothetical protein